MRMMQGRTKSGGQILLIPQQDIYPNPSQPRKRFDSEELEGLAESIRLNGIIQPINVRRRDDGYYELIAGERRLRAARMVGLPRIPCILMEVTDEKSALFALLENLQREDLNFFEEAAAIQKMMTEFGLSQEDTARRLGKAQSTVSNKLRLLKLPDDVRHEILKAGLTERHARALLRLENSDNLTKVLSIIIDKRLNVAETDRLVSQMFDNTLIQKKPPTKLFKDVRIFINTLNHAVDTMRRAGIEADSAKSETEQYIEYTVRIPKSGGYTIKARSNSA